MLIGERHTVTSDERAAYLKERYRRKPDNTSDQPPLKMADLERLAHQLHEISLIPTLNTVSRTQAQRSAAKFYFLVRIGRKLTAKDYDFG